MRLRATAALGTITLAVGLAGAAAFVPAAQAADDQDWCSVKVGTPCIISAAVNGTPVAKDDDTWDIYAFYGGPSGGSKSFEWWVERIASPGSRRNLGAAATDDHWVITIDTGHIVPRVATMTGDAMVIDRQPQGDGTYHVTVEGTPIPITAGAQDGTNDDCDQSAWPWTCKETAVRDVDAVFGGWITDYGSWDDVDQRESFYGMNYATNIEATDIPPQVFGDPSAGTAQLVIGLANPHFQHDGDVFHGFLHMRIPNAFLKAVYDVDDPASMSGTSLTTSYSGAAPGSGTTTVSQEASGNAMLVDASGLTFSSKRLHIKPGVVTPTRATNLKAHRVTSHRGRIAFTRAKARGSHIRGYQARCVSLNKNSVVKDSGPSTPLVVHGLRAHTAYDCRVRAKSKAGFGKWSKPDRMPRHA
jgi:hypothetical protein